MVEEAIKAAKWVHFAKTARRENDNPRFSSEGNLRRLFCQQNANSTTPDGWGRVSYERKGECFFIPFGTEDVEGEFCLDTGDEVYFYVATDKR